MFKVKNINAGIVLLKKTSENEYYTLIGSYYNKNNIKIYTFPGGTYSKYYDKTALHTAIREFVEEIFNIKISDIKLNEIVKGVKDNNLLLDTYIYKPNRFITFFATFKLLNFIYKCIYDHKFNLYKFLSFRNKDIKEKFIAKDGLNEFYKIHFIKINILLKNNNSIKIREISKYILQKIKILFRV